MKKHIFKGEILDRSNKNTISVIAELVVKTLNDISDDEYKSNKISYNLSCGYQVYGVLFYDVYRSTRNFSNLPIKEHETYTLKLVKNQSVTIIPIVITKKDHEIEISDNTFRYFFSFCNTHKVTQDDIYLFDESFSFLEYPRMFRFNATKRNNQYKVGIVNAVNKFCCVNIIKNFLIKEKFIYAEEELNELKIEEIVFSKDKICFVE